MSSFVFLFHLYVRILNSHSVSFDIWPRSADFHFPPLASQIRHILLVHAAATARHRPFLQAARLALAPPTDKDKTKPSTNTATVAAPAPTSAAAAAAAKPKDTSKEAPSAVVAAAVAEAVVAATTPASAVEFLDARPALPVAQLLAKHDKMFGAVPTPTFAPELAPTASVLDRDRADSVSGAGAGDGVNSPLTAAASPPLSPAGAPVLAARGGDPLSPSLPASTGPVADATSDASPSPGPAAASPNIPITLALNPSPESDPTPSPLPEPELPTPPHWLTPGDFVVTRHSNLRDVQVLFHLMGARPHKKGKAAKQENERAQAQLLAGLRQVLLTADQSGVASLVIPLLLSGTCKYVLRAHSLVHVWIYVSHVVNTSVCRVSCPGAPNTRCPPPRNASSTPSCAACGTRCSN